jgi:hypothetical protein
MSFLWEGVVLRKKRALVLKAFALTCWNKEKFKNFKTWFRLIKKSFYRTRRRK